MSSPDFVFAMRCAGREQFDHMLAEVAATVFRHVGCADAIVADLVGQLTAAITPDPGTECLVQFRAHAGEFEAIVFAHSREIWRTSRRMPQL